MRITVMVLADRRAREVTIDGAITEAPAQEVVERAADRIATELFALDGGTDQSVDLDARGLRAHVRIKDAESIGEANTRVRQAMERANVGDVFTWRLTTSVRA